MGTVHEAFKTWLEGEAAARPGVRLPADRQLAARLGVSSRTVARWMKAAGTEGLVTRVRGHGTHAGIWTGNGAVSAGVPRALAAENLASRVRVAIGQGELRVGRALPPVKYLCGQYQVSARTVRAACAQLERAGLIGRYGRLWRVVPARLLAGVRPRGTVYLVSAGGDFSEVFVKDMMAPAYRAMERELHLSGCTLRCIGLEECAGAPLRWRGDGGIPRGLAFYKATEETMERIAGVIDGLRSAVATREVPVLVDRWTGTIPLIRRHQAVLNRATVLTSFALEFVRTCRAERFARVVFFLTPKHAVWNHFAPEQVYAVLWRELRASATEVGRLAVLGRDGSVPKNEKGAVEFLARSMARYLGPKEFCSGESLVSEVAVWRGYPEHVGRSGTRTLWVFPSDRTAVEAMDWLAGQRVPVPGRVAVVGLGNDPAFYQRGLSCVTPDWEGIGYLMAHTLLNDIPVARTAKGFVETRALVVGRASA